MGGKSALLRSSIGAKNVMAISGLLLIAFVVVHMLGNLQIFLGQDSINAYGAKLREFPGFLWSARAGLLFLVLLHIYAGVKVSIANRRARGTDYARKKNLTTSLAARSMLISGVIILIYVVYHLLHFTTRTVHDQHSHLMDVKGRHDVYSMVVGSFQDPWIASFYVLSMILLGLHLGHGTGSFLQTLGIHHPRYHASFRYIGVIVSILLVVGYVVVPLAVLAGWLELPGGHGS